YRLTTISSGTERLVVRAFGFPVTSVPVTMQPGIDLDQLVELDSTAAGAPAISLQPMEVRATPLTLADRRLVDFERRRLTGRGQYLTDEEIVKSGAANLSDATRTMHGVTLHCGGTNE